MGFFVLLFCFRSEATAWSSTWAGETPYGSWAACADPMRVAPPWCTPLPGALGMTFWNHCFGSTYQTPEPCICRKVALFLVELRGVKPLLAGCLRRPSRTGSRFWTHGCGSKLNLQGATCFWSMLPLTRVLTHSHVV